MDWFGCQPCHGQGSTDSHSSSGQLKNGLEFKNPTWKLRHESGLFWYLENSQRFGVFLSFSLAARWRILQVHPMQWKPSPACGSSPPHLKPEQFCHPQRLPRFVQDSLGQVYSISLSWDPAQNEHLSAKLGSNQIFHKYFFSFELLDRTVLLLQCESAQICVLQLDK